MPAASMLQVGGVRTRRSNKTITFTGAANLGAVGSVPIYTVTGEILVIAFAPMCTVDLVGNTATIALGYTGATTFWSTAITAENLDVGEWWLGAGVLSGPAVALPTNFGVTPLLLTDNILGTVATAAITAGAIRFDLLWIPMSPDGNVT